MVTNHGTIMLITWPCLPGRQTWPNTRKSRCRCCVTQKPAKGRLSSAQVATEAVAVRSGISRMIRVRNQWCAHSNHCCFIIGHCLNLEQQHFLRPLPSRTCMDVLKANDPNHDAIMHCFMQLPMMSHGQVVLLLTGAAWTPGAKLAPGLQISPKNDSVQCLH